MKTNHHPHCYQLQQTFIYVGNTNIGASLVAQMVKNPLAMWETWVGSLGWEEPVEEGTATHSSILALENPQGQRNLVGCSPWGLKDSDTTE